MLIEFQFNARARAILLPENARDKQMLQLFAGGAVGVRLVHASASMPEAIIFEAIVEKETEHAANFQPGGPAKA